MIKGGTMGRIAASIGAAAGVVGLAACGGHDVGERVLAETGATAAVSAQPKPGGGGWKGRAVDAQTRADIEQLIGSYANFWEFGHCEEWANLFAEDGSFFLVTGRPALAEACAARPQSRNSIHAQVNTMLVHVDRNHVRGFTNVIFGSNTPGQPGATFAAYGDYHELFVRTKDGWKWQSRVADVHQGTPLPAEFLADN